MVDITFDGSAYACGDDETVLQALLRQNVDIPYSCEKGSCLTCLVKASGDNIPAEARANLNPALIEQGFILACMCRPKAALTLGTAEDAVIYGRATVSKIEALTAEVSRVFLSVRPESY